MVYTGKSGRVGESVAVWQEGGIKDADRSYPSFEVRPTPQKPPWKSQQYRRVIPYQRHKTLSQGI